MVNASFDPTLFRNNPTAVHSPGNAHDTDLNSEKGLTNSVSLSNCAGCANSQSPFVDVMVNASIDPKLFVNPPTAVQFPGDAHETDSKYAFSSSFCTSVSNCAGCA
jgi:hypothetical protein